MNSNGYVRYVHDCNGYIQQLFIVGDSIIIQRLSTACRFLVITLSDDLSSGLSDIMNLDLEAHPQLAGDRHYKYNVCDVATIKSAILMMVSFCEDDHLKKYKILKLSGGFEITFVIDLDWFTCHPFLPPTICCNQETLNLTVCFCNGKSYDDLATKRMIQQISPTGALLNTIPYTFENTAVLRKIYFTPLGDSFAFECDRHNYLKDNFNRLTKINIGNNSVYQEIHLSNYHGMPSIYLLQSTVIFNVWK